jgi:hypothetical protein
MKHGVASILLLLLLGIALVGCEPPRPAANASAPPATPGTTPAATASAAPATPAAPTAPLPPETKFGAFAGDVNDLAARPAAAQPAPAPAVPAQLAQDDPSTERVKAQAGVGIKGRSLDQYEGVVVTPVKAFFSSKERAFFDIEFPGNYRLWRVENEAPKDFDDLKARFLDPLGLTGHLPKLPVNHKYVWDQAKEELQVERPRPGGTPQQ